MQNPPQVRILEVDPDPTWAYFWPEVNKRLARHWPGYFLIRRKKLKTLWFLGEIFHIHKPKPKMAGLTQPGLQKNWPDLGQNFLTRTVTKGYINDTTNYNKWHLRQCPYYELAIMAAHRPSSVGFGSKNFDLTHVRSTFWEISPNNHKFFNFFYLNQINLVRSCQRRVGLLFTACQEYAQVRSGYISTSTPSPENPP